MTPIYHLNVKFYRNGILPIGTFDSNILMLWKSEYTILEVLKDLYFLFYNNNPLSPYDYTNHCRRNEFENNRNLFREKALFFANKYKNKIVIDSDSDWNFEYNK